MITDETITDEQIRELREALLSESGNQMTCDTDACPQALIDVTEPRFNHARDVAEAVRMISRARCAEILNARGGK